MNGLEIAGTTALIVLAIRVVWKLVVAYVPLGWTGHLPGMIPEFVKKHWIWTIVIVLATLIFLPEIKATGTFIFKAAAAVLDSAFNGTPRSEWDLLPGSVHTSDTRAEEVEQADSSDLRYDHFIEAGRDWGWETLPTEVELTLPFDGKSRYTGLNVALMGGGKIQVSCPGYVQDGSYTIFFREDTGKWFPLSRPTEELVVTGLGNLHGAYMTHGRVSSRNPGRVSYTMEAIPKEGHTRIATWKMAAKGGENLSWGRLPAPAAYKWNLYVRFADEQGFTLTPSSMQQYPATIHIGEAQASQTDGVSKKLELVVPSETPFKVLSEPEKIFGNHSVHEEDPFLAIAPPAIPGKNVRIEVILDITHR
ncbi:MAG: hypothetical protein A3C02_02090 [Candidatus Andersenbacteria bacterium RIFCSPHIGHO2_02_FULL_45_11]|uniref:Uncharacterized protein n=1 Tax=Candidatus Andersenbacteria bacterium RIFCSPHIGHO2_12_FULL_45_11 TaxID=1797281 RepID=A0A1G1X4H0_9BACT|nr:MAG: hypothetical protein A2805_03230 [Candidatus Andersenbacteria bacterium RIFCSPHIGHO2_01_FULL_46_36]OGY34883.1 MAG: hypothetical protein A3C02_02090 [Candidatus Andersenbacteria bacterium RIFCSPHIGHO2_02_FULL_45_11]OGY34916.1 MAG: hypothetical protein A3D99_03530 [Candidatus Andersenbacteria bacterium RIFCSPHIGHO2_12_FULL_45_11]